jgi:hypothetical protein
MKRCRKESLSLGFVLFITSLCPAAFAGQAAAQRDAAVDPAAVQALKSQIDALKAEYEKRIKDLETQVEALQLQMLRGTPETEAPAGALQQPSMVQAIPGALNPALTVVGNFVARGDSQKIFNEEGVRIDNRLNLRETELDLRTAIDPYADGVVIASIGSDSPGHYAADVEEAYVTVKKIPFIAQTPLGLKLKIGRFRPSFGTDNILHTHDLPQTFRPLPIEEFLGEEGFSQSGISGNFFIPTPWDRKASMDATLQVLSGGDVAISPDVASRNSYLGHLRWFRTFGDSHNLELGWSSYYHPAGNGVRETDFHGLDFMYRWKPLRLGEWKSFVLSGELMFARRAYPGAAESPDVIRALEGTPPGAGKPVGFTVFGQWQFNRRIYSGLRWDQTDVLYNPALRRRSLTPYLSYYFSEFLRFRLNYEHRWSDLFTEDGRQSLFAEVNFVFGSHPPEPFWVNK